jgi:DNA-binding beta-propeller fold protein YncE
MKRRELLFALGFGGAIALSPLHSATAREPDPIELPAGFQYPNGIARASNGTLYVGSVTSGQILQIDPNGKIETLFPGNDEIFASTSLRLDKPRGILWGASPDFLGTQPNSKTAPRPHRIFALDVRSGKVKQVIQMPNSGFGNDIAIDPKGGIYLTDSLRHRIYYLPSGANQLQTWVESDRLRSQGQIGLAGIAMSSDGSAIVNQFSDGKMFQVTPQSQRQATIEEIVLERPLENPDGIQFASNGLLLVTEGGVESGNGRLLQIDLSAPNPKPVEVIAENLISPVNLTTAGNEIWVTESQIRHRLIPGKENEIPDRFFVRRFVLPKTSD